MRRSSVRLEAIVRVVGREESEEAFVLEVVEECWTLHKVSMISPQGI